MTSCGACGGELGPITFCPTCEENVQWKCASCNKETDISVHTHGGRIIRPADIRMSERAATFAAA
jgi:hypothetical protein